MNMIVTGGSAVGEVKVFATNNRGLNPEELADLTVDRLIYVGRNSHPVIIEQAKAFKDHMRQVLVNAFIQAQLEERNTICAKLDTQGLGEISDTVRSL